MYVGPSTSVERAGKWSMPGGGGVHGELLCVALCVGIVRRGKNGTGWILTKPCHVVSRCNATILTYVLVRADCQQTD